MDQLWFCHEIFFMGQEFHKTTIYEWGVFLKSQLHICTKKTMLRHPPPFVSLHNLCITTSCPVKMDDLPNWVIIDRCLPYLYLSALKHKRRRLFSLFNCFTFCHTVCFYRWLRGIRLFIDDERMMPTSV